MLKAVLVGLVLAIALSHGAVVFSEHIATLTPGSSWLIALAAPVQVIPSLVPGFVAGWLAQTRGIKAGFTVGLVGTALYSVLFGAFWGSLAGVGASEAVSVVLWLVLLSFSSALYGAVSGGTAQLLRSNNVLQSDARNARA